MTVSPYYELRLYQMLPTRMPDFHDLLGVKVPPLFAKCGIPRPLGFWESYASPYGPLFGYLIPWDSIDTRMDAWQTFYGNPVWQKHLAQNYSGAQRVDRANVLILRPADVWAEFRSQSPVAPVSGVHEMRVYPASKTELSQALSAAVSEGAEVLGVFDAWIGAPLGQSFVFLAWPDEAHRANSNDALDRVLCPQTNTIMTPIQYGIPLRNLVPKEPIEF